MHALKTTLYHAAVTKCYGSDGIVESYMSRIGNTKYVSQNMSISNCVSRATYIKLIMQLPISFPETYFWPRPMVIGSDGNSCRVKFKIVYCVCYKFTLSCKSHLKCWHSFTICTLKHVVKWTSCLLQRTRSWVVSQRSIYRTEKSTTESHVCGPSATQRDLSTPPANLVKLPFLHPLYFFNS